MIQGHQYTKYFKGIDFNVFVIELKNNHVTAIYTNPHTLF